MSSTGTPLYPELPTEEGDADIDTRNHEDSGTSDAHDTTISVLFFFSLEAGCEMPSQLPTKSCTAHTKRTRGGARFFSHPRKDNVHNSFVLPLVRAIPQAVKGMAAIGAVAGMVVIGPIAAVAAGVGGALVASGVAGPGKGTDAARSVGKAASSAASSIWSTMKSIDQKHNVLDRTKAALGKGVEKAKAIDAEHNVVDRTKAAATEAGKKAVALDAKYKITDQLVAGVTTGANALNAALNTPRAPGSAAGSSAQTLPNPTNAPR